jgi:hypothetical protein
MLLIGLLLWSCGISAQYLVTEHYDQFENVRTFTLQNQYLSAATTEIALTNLIDLRISKVVRPDTTLLLLTVFHQGNSRFYLDDGISLVMLIDGVRYEFEQLWAKHGAVERGYYGIAPESFYRLAHAKTVAVKIIGDDGYLERAIHPQTLAKYQRFYAEYLK